LQLSPGQRCDGRSGDIQKAPLLVARLVGIQHRVVADHYDAVARDGAIELERAHAQLECV
jgi:hypothetical protein